MAVSVGQRVPLDVGHRNHHAVFASSTRLRATVSKEICAIDQPPTDDQGHQRFYDSPANRKPKCAKAEDREQNPKRFRLGAHGSIKT
jgi:hypothetical protein